MDNNLSKTHPEGNVPCQMCGKTKSCRPIGPNNEELCFDCATSTPELAAQSKEKLEKLNS